MLGRSTVKPMWNRAGAVRLSRALLPRRLPCCRLCANSKRAADLNWNRTCRVQVIALFGEIIAITGLSLARSPPLAVDLLGRA